MQGEPAGSAYIERARWILAETTRDACLHYLRAGVFALQSQVDADDAHDEPRHFVLGSRMHDGKVLLVDEQMLRHRHFETARKIAMRRSNVARLCGFSIRIRKTHQGRLFVSGVQFASSSKPRTFSCEKVLEDAQIGGGVQPPLRDSR
jgi:hypothetical protein